MKPDKTMMAQAPAWRMSYLQSLSNRAGFIAI
jgi:hypothetical protein